MNGISLCSGIIRRICRRAAWLFATSLILIGCCANSVYAGTSTDPMNAYYGNTLVCSGPTWECHMWLSPDGTYVVFSMDVVDGKPTIRGGEGRWRVINGRFCRDPDDPKRNSCQFPSLTTHEEGRKLGERWEGTNRGGQIEHFALLAGHQ